MKYRVLIALLLTINVVLAAEGKRIGLLVLNNCRGEVAFAYRVQSACKNIHWKADILNVNNNLAIKKSKYDFVINLVPRIYKHPSCKNYLCIFDPVNHYFEGGGFLHKTHQNYDGYLLTFSPQSLGDENKSFSNPHQFPYMLWYPTAQSRAYRTNDPLYLFHICCSWGDRFINEKFQRCLSLLDQEPYVRFYGSSKFKTLYPNNYHSVIPFHDESLFTLAGEAGVSLIFHSSIHNAYGLPSGRIFEAAASSTVIICDQNSFVQQHFGDSVLYINTEEDGLSIYHQIHKHMEWIWANKPQAIEKAKKAHEIYQKKFALEDQLLRLGKFHERLSK